MALNTKIPPVNKITKATVGAAKSHFLRSLTASKKIIEAVKVTTRGATKSYSSDTVASRDDENHSTVFTAMPQRAFAGKLKKGTPKARQRTDKGSISMMRGDSSTFAAIPIIDISPKILH